MAPALRRSPTLQSPFLGTDLSDVRLSEIVDCEDKLVHLVETVSQRVAEAKAIITAKVKYREDFRPFAPSTLHQLGDESF